MSCFPVSFLGFIPIFELLFLSNSPAILRRLGLLRGKFFYRRVRGESRRDRREPSRTWEVLSVLCGCSRRTQRSKALTAEFAKKGRRVGRV